ncbi:hypothetical protein [Spirillospora albida]|uniref:hypothetical protein n=1 Tax=Spirillospora albida TaxID=58123 RepID=UPI0004BE79DC|nr:hypothetical protein [Spirillospora albida]
MGRRRVLIPVAVAVVAGAVVAGFLLARGAPERDAGVAGSTGRPSGTAVPPVDRSRPGWPDELFVNVTAAHLCRIQSTVFPDAATQAAAYAAAPRYPAELTADQVAERVRRLRTDAALSKAVTDRLSATCRPGGA